MSRKKIYIVRHGQTEMNQKKVLQGRSDFPLNGTGETQAKEAADWFRDNGVRIGRIWSSPLQRAVRTARIIAGEDVPLETDPRLIEMDYGPYEGADLTKPPQEIITFFSDFVHNPAPEGMEQLSSVTARLGDFLEELARRQQEESDPEASDLEEIDPEGQDGPAESILISTHAIAMKGALEYLTPDSGGAYWSKYIRNCAVFAVDLEDGKYGTPEEVF